MPQSLAVSSQVVCQEVSAQCTEVVSFGGVSCFVHCLGFASLPSAVLLACFQASVTLFCGCDLCDLVGVQYFLSGLSPVSLSGIFTL